MNQTNKHVPQVGDIWAHFMRDVHPALFGMPDDFWFEMAENARPELPAGMTWERVAVYKNDQFPIENAYDEDGEPTSYRICRAVTVDLRVIKSHE